MIFTWDLAASLILLAAFVYLIVNFLLPPFLGAPYVPASRVAVAAMVAMAKIEPRERAVDLGSGDGRIVIALAQAGAEAHGYETNPSLVLWSRFKIWRLGLRKKAFIHWQSFNACDFSKFTVITAYTLPRFMKDLEPKLQAALPRGARVVAHRFQFPHWQPTEVKDKVYLYKA